MCAASREFREHNCGDGSAKVIFSAMPELSRAAMAEYFTRLQSMETSIDWSVIRPKQFESMSPNRHAGLQMADCVASGFFAAEHPMKEHRTAEWAELMKPVLFRGARGQYRGWGLKVFPLEAEKQITQGHRCPWVTDFYPE